MATAAVGKKRKKVYVYRDRRGKKSLLIPLLLVGGVAAYYFISKNRDASQVVTDPGSPILNDDGTITSPPFVQPPAIVVSPDTSYPLISAAAIADRGALKSYAGKDGNLLAALDRMNDAEIIASYNYVFGYIIQGKKLYQYPNATGIFSDGGWDTALYNAVTAIRMKYGIFK